MKKIYLAILSFLALFTLIFRWVIQIVKIQRSKDTELMEIENEIKNHIGN